MSARRGAGIDKGIVWERVPWRTDHLIGVLIYVFGCVTMIAAGVFLILMGPQG
jgi:hypothetical protein